MMQIRPNYIVDDNNHKIGVQLDIETYNKMTEALENYALVQLMEQNNDEEALSIKDAREFYQKLKQK
ncbi:hypothetical protein TI05_09345 [Achromatium sp. WMS3]|nr:hypothetical protein TI05_09345 [Achromatium sp. WMS3]